MGLLARSILVSSAIVTLAAACEPSSATAPQGEVRGVVLVEGTSLEGVVVELTGPQVRSATTDVAGRYSFDAVPSGAYVVSVRSVPDDSSFPATSRTAVVSGAQTVTVDFLGNYIRTASVEGSVTSGTQGLAGVTVMLEGAQSSTTITSLGGGFTFTGLRAGQYQVEISGLPGSVTFPSTRTEFDLSIGQTFLVTFEGVPELTASVVIRSIARRLPGGGTELADPQDLRGELEVVLTVDRGEDTLVAAELLLDDQLVGRQTFGTGAQATEAPLPAPPPQAPFDIVYRVDTAQFEPTTGAVKWPNGQVLLTARLATVEGGPSAWLSSVQVRLQNTNTFTGSMTPSGGPVLGENGAEWVGGDLALSIVPVLYDEGRAVSSVTVDLRRTSAGQLRVKSEAGSAPFSLTLRGGGDPAGDNVAQYQTPVGATDELRVVSALYDDGGNVPGVPAVLETDLRIDNVGPAPATFALPLQGADQSCCLDNWVGAAFQFDEAVGLQPDAGVGAVTATVHVDDAGLPDDVVAAQPPVFSGGDLAPTQDNTARRAVVASRDGLGNITRSPLAPSDGNALSDPLGAVLGVDHALPQLGFATASVADRALNPTAGSAWVLEATDEDSGVGSMAARTSVRLSNPAVAGTAAECVFPGTAECEPAVDGLVRSVPDGVEGYLQLMGYVLDRGGNISNTVTRSVLRDLTPPSILVAQVQGATSPNAQATVSAVLSDNVDLSGGWMALEFGEAGTGGPEALPLLPLEAVGVPFDEELTTDAGLAQTIPLLPGLERVTENAGVDEPSGTVLALNAARAVVLDAAGNLTTRSEVLPAGAGFATRSFSVAERGGTGGVADWALGADATQVCRSGSESTCPLGVATSVQLTGQARGLGGALEQPFADVHFLVVRGGEPQWIGSTSAAQMQDGAGPLGRAWSWSVDWTPDTSVPLGPLNLFAVGVDPDGNALRTMDLTSVSVVAGP